MSWAAIRDGMGTRLRTISVLAVHERAPAAVTDGDVAIVTIGQQGIVPVAHGGVVEVYVRVVLIVARATPEDAERAIDGYLWPVGATSVIAAVMAEPTLGGAVDWTTWVSSATPYGESPTQGTRQSEVQFCCAVTV